MKDIGIVRKLDTLGRIVVPKELRRMFDIENEDSVEIFVEGDTIVLKKYAPTCFFCKNENIADIFKGKNICRECLDELKKL